MPRRRTAFVLRTTAGRGMPAYELRDLRSGERLRFASAGALARYLRRCGRGGLR